MPSELELYNSALSELGEETQISDPDTLTPGRQLRVLRGLLPTLRDAMLRSQPWLCCTRRRLLPILNTRTGDDWKYSAAFLLPVNWLRVWAVDERCRQWERGFAEERDGSGAVIATRAVIWGSGSTALRAVVIERPPYEQLDPLLFNAMAIGLARRAAGPLQADKALQRSLRDDAREAIADAIAAETSEFGNEGELFESRWLEARGGGWDGDLVPW